MDHDQLKLYNSCQVLEIEKHKWYLSERLQHDVGFSAAAMDWIKNYAKDFHDWWFTTHLSQN